MPLTNPTPPLWELEKYRPLLRLLANQIRLDPRLQARFDASDIVQEALLRAHNRRDQFRGTTEAELVRWLQEILHNAFRDLVNRDLAQRRDFRREVGSLQACTNESSVRLDRYLAIDDPDPVQRLQRLETLQQLARALEELPESQRDAVVLRHYHRLPVKEIAERLGKTEKAVAGLLSRGLGQLGQSIPDTW